MESPLLILLLSLLCHPPEAAPAPAKLRVLTSFLPVYCFTANVAGDLAQVDNLLPPGQGPHEYLFTPRDVARLKNADLLVINGLGLEEWTLEARNLRLLNPKTKVIELARGWETHLIKDDRGTNPHVWLDPVFARHAVSNVLEALRSADPAKAQAYTTRARSYLARLEDLHEKAGRTLAPLRDRPFLTQHDAFPYFIRRYELTLAGVIEENPNAEPSPRHLRDLSQTIRQRKVRALFIEPQYPGKLARQLAADFQMQLGELDTLETGPLAPDAYEKGMERNIAVLNKLLSTP